MSLLIPKYIEDKHLPTDSAHQLAIGHDDVYIAVMGLTGSGKSSFIRDATGQDVRVCDDFDACKI